MTIDFLTLLLLCVAALFLGVTLVLRAIVVLIERNVEDEVGLGCLGSLFYRLPLSVAVIFMVLPLLWGYADQWVNAEGEPC